VRELRWENVDLSARIARVWPEDAKAGQPIPVPLNSAAIEVPQAQLGRHPTHVFVYECIRRRGKEKVIVRAPITLRSNNTAWRKARACVGLPDLRFHDLRHSWATWHKAAGTPDFELQQMGAGLTAACCACTRTWPPSSCSRTQNESLCPAPGLQLKAHWKAQSPEPAWTSPPNSTKTTWKLRS